ncbi:prophage endopeptidase [Xenorhabdus japonica]|uniref:Prophage endopeptidase n=1 Tax=Xenorhabdus japonica TaxID=53341 RepID=A0A1I5C7H8_9GAMM|nr:prophage endopeptidase [Xenorhabdus japonica]
MKLNSQYFTHGALVIVSGLLWFYCSEYQDKAEIDRLHTASLAHPKRVYIKAKCPVSKTAAPSGMDDAATARSTDSAIRNYWVLRERIATSEQMILGLQEYVRTQCG